MNKLKPWAQGPFELINHAEMHLKGKTDFDKRIALVSFDNAIELSIITYLSLNPIQRGGQQFQTTDVDRWSKNFHTKIEFFEHYVRTLLGKPMDVERDEFIFYHQLRNDLYHSGNGVVPAETHIDGIRTAALWFFSILFQVDAEELLREKNPPQLKPTQQTIELSPTSAFLENSITLQKSLNALLLARGMNSSSKHTTSLERWEEIAKTLGYELSAQYTSVVQEAKGIRDAITAGEPLPPNSTDLRKLSDEIAVISEQIDARLCKYQIDIVENAIKATINALPPNGNRRAGIVVQTTGSGLGLSTVSYLLRTRLLPEMRDKHIIVAADRLEVAEQIYRLIWESVSHEKAIQAVLPRTKSELVEVLSSKKPKIVFSTVQKFIDAAVSSQEILFVGYDLSNIPNKLPTTLPNATWILFTNVSPQQSSISAQIFGNVISKYDFARAVDDRIVVPIRIERRSVEGMNKDMFGLYQLTSEHAIELEHLRNQEPSDELVHRIARDLVHHFELQQKEREGKAVIVVPNLALGNRLYKEMVHLRPHWHNESEIRGVLKIISATTHETQKAILLQRFCDKADPFSLTITTGAWLIGLANPLVQTAYVLSPVSSQIRQRLAGLVSRKYPGKEYGLIVDYMNLDWNLK